MNEILIYRIIIGVVIAGILWLYFRRNKVNQAQVDDSAILEKEKEIEGLKKEKDGFEKLVALLTFGEGWHSNHHKHAKGYTTKAKWWELDLTGIIINALLMLNIIHSIKPLKK